MSAIDLSWLAAFTEADGSLQISRVTHGHQWRIVYTQALHHQTAIDAIEEILKTFKILYRRWSQTNRKFPAEIIYIYRKDEVRKLLIFLMPFFRSEDCKIKAELMLKSMDLDYEGREKSFFAMKEFKTKSYSGKRGGRFPYKLKREFWSTINSMLDEGKSLAEIGRKFGVTKTAIWYYKEYLRNKKEGSEQS